jgi:hypothetical protein
MYLDTVTLQCFLAVADTGSFTKADFMKIVFVLFFPDY